MDEQQRAANNLVGNNVSELDMVQAQVVGLGAKCRKVPDECSVLVAHNNDTIEQPNLPRNKDKQRQKPFAEVSESREFKGHYMDTGNIKDDTGD